MPRSASSDAGDRRPADAVEEERERRQRDDLGRDEEGERRDPLREPDRAAVARREDERRRAAACSRSATNARSRPSSAVKTIATQSSPLAASVARSAGSAKWKIDERREDEEQHRGQRVARPQLEQQVLARERGDVGEVPHASASRPVASGATRSGSCVATSRCACRAAPRARGRAARAVVVERAERLVEDQQLGLVQERRGRARAAAACPRENAAGALARAPPRARSARAASRSARAAPAPGRAGRRGRGSRAPSARGRRAARGPRKPIPPRSASTSSVAARRHGEPGAEPQQRRLPGAVRPGDDEEAAARELEVDARAARA